MDILKLNKKARELCDKKICCSMAEARRMVMCGVDATMFRKNSESEKEYWERIRNKQNKE